MKNNSLLFAIAASLVLSAGAMAQSYSIDWYKVSGGGGTSSGGTYTLSGTIGQPDAGPAMGNGANYSLTGGFWAIYAVNVPGSPVLSITYVNGKAMVSWPTNVTGWTLQTNVNLATPTWGNYLGPVINNSVSNSPPPKNLFFRLKK